jgi:hypothetical protein
MQFVRKLDSKTSYQQFLIDDSSQDIIPESEINDDYNNIDLDEIEIRYPQFQDLNIEVYHSVNHNGNAPEIKEYLYPNLDGTWAYRGDTVTVSGKLWSGVPGDDWDFELVKLLYNVTQTQYESDPSSYDADPQYYVTSDTTDNNGNFTFNIDTSTLTTNPYSKVGVINILTYFDGDLAQGRGPGSPGGANMTFYGQISLHIISAVTNPSASYSFTTEMLYDNGSVVVTQGTQYHLNVLWSGAGSHTNQNYTIGGTNQHIYSNTAPGPAEEDVTYEAYYNFAPLSLDYFVQYGSTNPSTAGQLLYNTTTERTENQVVVDAYYVTGSGLSKIPQEIHVGTTFTVYANLTSATGLEPGMTIRVSYEYDGSEIGYKHYTTNATDAAIQFTTTLNQSTYSDITKIFIIHLEPLASEFGGATLNPDALDSILTVNVTTITVTISDTSVFYTTGQSIGYTVTITDQYGTSADQSQFQLSFPGLAPQIQTANNGFKALTTTIPDYSINETQTKTIAVGALNVTSLRYKYYVYGTVFSIDLFDVYFALTLTLTDPNNGNVLDGSTWTEFNNTFWTALGTRDYQLTVTDQWGRNPLGATITLSLTGGTSPSSQQQVVTGAINWVNFSYTDFTNAGLYEYEAYTGLSLSAGGGAYTPETTITQTINIYGPDNDAPEITSIIQTPNPNDPGIHIPYFNITFNVIATDVGTGVRNVSIMYETATNNETGPWGNTTVFLLYHKSGNLYEGTINMTIDFSKYYIRYWITVYDYAGWGLDQFGSRQGAPVYDGDFGLEYTSPEGQYQIGDFVPPREESASITTLSADPNTPYVNISVFVNDSTVYSGMGNVWLIVQKLDYRTGQPDLSYGAIPADNGTRAFLMINIVGTNEYFYIIIGEYNYEYVWYIEAVDTATPSGNLYVEQSRNVYSAVELNPPTVSNLLVSYNGTVITPNSVLTFNATVTDDLTSVAFVTLVFTFYGNTYRFNMTRIGVSSTYMFAVDLSDAAYAIDQNDYGTHILVYHIETEDGAGNTRTTTDNSLSVLYENPFQGPGGIGGNIWAIVGGAVGGLVVLIGVLFLWINRHTLQTFAKKQTFRRRLRDYLREIIEDIKKDGLEGRYKEGLLKTWSVVEGIGREFFNLPRYKSQTPMEFSKLLARGGKIEPQLMYTLLEYFNKARYGFEEITETDFNSGVRALLKIVDKIEVGEMQIES